MTYRVRFRKQAEEDLVEAYRWYESRIPGLGVRLLSSVDSVVKLIESQPLIFRESLPGIRRALLNRFPYSVYFRFLDNEIEIVAILHQKRNQPDRLQDRR